MKIAIYPTYAELSVAAAADFISHMQESPTPLCCIASGDSPVGLYNELARQFRESKLDISNWRFAGLDEWLGMDGSDEGSCRHMLERTVVKPLQLKVEQTCFFDGKTQNAQDECDRVETFIKNYGGLDISVLGLGLNGHLGLNEPGTPFSAGAHVSTISASTQAVGQKYFSSPTLLTKGITLGLGSLMQSKNISLIVSGEKKAAITREFIEGEITEQIPASILQKHPSCIVYLDEAAASFLSKKTKAHVG